MRTDLSRVTWCDCSICRKKNAVMTAVHESAFTLLSGEDQLATYRWNSKVAEHHFCKVCGIYTHHRKRMMPDHFGINLNCIEGLDVEALNVISVDGVRHSIVE